MTNLRDIRLACIGAGNMAEALVKGLLRAGLSPAQVTVTDVRHERLDYFRSAYGVQAAPDNRAAAKAADVILLAVKPQQMNDVLAELAGATERALFVSIAAGIPTARIERALGAPARVVRVMPNTPALVGAGISALCGGAHAAADDLALAEVLLQAVGQTVRVDEALMDAVTAVSGSGPAYIFRVMEAMEAAAVQHGLPQETARSLVLATVAGAGQLAQSSRRAPSELREQVTSKGGTTEAALKVLNERDIAGAFSDAIAAAVRRARELAG